MEATWKECIARQREELASMLCGPIERVAGQLVPVWPEKSLLERALSQGFSGIPYCTSLYVLDPGGIQLTENIGRTGVLSGHYRRDRSGRPYMQEPLPSRGFLLSEAYISQFSRRPSLTALQCVCNGDTTLGYLGADFDLRHLPVTADLYKEPGQWRQIKGDPAIRGQLFSQTRVESPMDRSLDQSLAILEELLTERGVFQAQIHFSSSQATIWTAHDPYRYRILDIDALTDPGICLVYPLRAYPARAQIPFDRIAPIFENFKALRMADENIYLRLATINLHNGLVSLTFSCDGSHYMPFGEFLQKSTSFWFGASAA